MSATTLAETASNHFMLVTMSQTGLSMTKTDRDARQRLALGDHVDETQYRVSKVLLPPDYATEYKALTAAMSAARSFFYSSTLPYGSKPDGSAAGPRIITIERIMGHHRDDGVSWISEMSGYAKDIDAKRANFAAALPGILQQISTDPRYSAQFDPDAYPTPAQILDSFKFTIEGPSPMARFDYVPLTGSVANALEQRFENQMGKALSFGAQTQAKEMLEFVQNMAKMANALVEHNDKGGEGKAPRMHATLVTNLQDAARKAREYAIPDTPEGAALNQIADAIEARLTPPERTTQHLKDSVPLARELAKEATSLAEEISELDVFF